MISNADNLGATLDPRIAGYVASEQIPFLMEVVEGTEADRKGGHIARRRADGQLVLRETAQTPPEDEESFRDFRHWRYYNTNNLWVDLRVLAETLERSDGVLELPLIVNRKTVDPRDPDSTPVIQLESAMGAAIESFPGARSAAACRAPGSCPVKTTDDLLVLRSDAYRLGARDGGRAGRRARRRLRYVELDPRFYRLLDRVRAALPGRAAVAARRRAAGRPRRRHVRRRRRRARRGRARRAGPRRIEPGAVLESGERERGRRQRQRTRRGRSRS